MISFEVRNMNVTAARLINLLSRKSQGYITDAMRPFGLTAAEQPFFMALLHNEGVTQERLTALVGVDKSATARVVKSMEEKGFLTRVQDDADRRQNLLFPTDKAKAIAADVKAALDQFNELLTDGISPEESAALRGTLLKMVVNLNRGRQGGDRHG